MWYNVRLQRSKGTLTLRTWAEDAAHAIANVVYLFPYNQGFSVLDCMSA